MSAALEHQAAKEVGVLALLRRNLCSTRTPLPPNLTLANRTVLITGANTGLGFEAARQFLQLCPRRLVMAVRSQSKGDDAAALLRSEFPNTIVDVWILDMESYASITAFAKRCDDELDVLDYALLNAGALFVEFATNKDTGHEMSTQVNFLSTALLMVLLLPIMKSKAKLLADDSHVPRLTAVGSAVMYGVAPPSPDSSILAQMDRPRSGLAGLELYRSSKLLLVAFVMALSRHVDPADVVVNVVNPSLCKGSAFPRHLTGAQSWRTRMMGRIGLALQSPMARSLDDGASTYLDGMLVQGDSSHGSFCSEWGIKPYAKCLYGKEGEGLVGRVWQETADELRFADVEGIMEGMRM